jgi:hypothetical protein
MLDHYQKYYALKKKQKELTNKIEQFNLKVQNFKKLENYSTQEIDTMARNISQIDGVIQRAKQYKVNYRIDYRPLSKWPNELSSQYKSRSTQTVFGSFTNSKHMKY